MTFKEKLLDRLGSVGMILYVVLNILKLTLPLVMIGASFWLNLLFISIMYFFPPSAIVFWIWSLVAALQGPQDTVAIIYYIVFAITFIPIFYGLIIDAVNFIRSKRG